MQVDAHVEFVRGWDVEIIEQWHSAKNEMAVLSNYLSGTSLNRGDVALPLNPDRAIESRPRT